MTPRRAALSCGLVRLHHGPLCFQAAHRDAEAQTAAWRNSSNLAVGPPGNEATAPTGIEGGGKDQGIRDEATYTRHSPTARWHKLSDITVAMLRQQFGGRR